VVFDPQLWGFDKQSNFTERQYQLIGAAADASEGRRANAAHGACALLPVAGHVRGGQGHSGCDAGGGTPTSENPTGLVMRAITNIMLNRPDEALKELNDPLVGDQFDAPLWRSFAYARQGKWADARTGFRNVEASIATLPIELQQLALREAMRAAIEVARFFRRHRQAA
jgi:hypothetical protein